MLGRSSARIEPNSLENRGCGSEPIPRTLGGAIFHPLRKNRSLEAKGYGRGEGGIQEVKRRERRGGEQKSEKEGRVNASHAIFP